MYIDIDIYISKMSGEGAGTSSEDAMRLAFEHYMRGGTKMVAVAEVDQEEASIRAEKEAKRQDERQLHKLQQEVKRAEKRYYQFFQKIGRVIQEEWLDIDDQAYQVVEAIKGIRNRLPRAVRLLGRMRDVVQKDEWARHGFNQVFVGSIDKRGSDFISAFGSCGSNGIDSYDSIQEQDIELALSHDLVQHEKMMEALRGLFANLSKCHEALLRNLDEMTKHHLECMDEFGGMDVVGLDSNRDGGGDTGIGLQKVLPLVGLMNDAMAMLSLELYRKQCLVHMILETSKDELIQCLDGERLHDGVDGADMSPQKAVHRCCTVWKRQCKESCIDTSLLDIVCAQ